MTVAPTRWACGVWWLWVWRRWWRRRLRQRQRWWRRRRLLRCRCAVVPTPSSLLVISMSSPSHCSRAVVAVTLSPHRGRRVAVPFPPAPSSLRLFHCAVDAVPLSLHLCRRAVIVVPSSPRHRRCLSPHHRRRAVVTAPLSPRWNRRANVAAPFLPAS